MIYTKIFFGAALLSGTLLLRGVDVSSVPQGSADHVTGLYETGETITFTFTGLAKETVYPVSLRGDQTIYKNFEAKSDASGNLKVETRLDRPGFVRASVCYDNTKEALAGAGVHPEKIRGARPMPADFAAFWETHTALLDKTPLKPELKAMPDKADFKIYDLTLPCPGSATPVRGYLAIKKDAAPQSCPALLSMQGAGVKSASPALSYAGKGYITLEINAHGIDNGRDKTYYADLNKNELKKYYFQGMLNREENYFLGMFLRAYRALQYLKSRPEWNGKVLVAYGSSQGGFQALAAGGLDPQVTAIVAFVAAGCDHGGALAGREDGWPHFCRETNYQQNQEKTAAELDYFDGVNFARQIKMADLFMSVGLIDDTCPAASSCAAYNEAPTTGKKQLIIGPKAGHQHFSAAGAGTAKFLDEHRKRK